MNYSFKTLRKTVAICIIGAATFSVNAQNAENLVPNGGFESVARAPKKLGSIEDAIETLGLMLKGRFQDDQLRKLEDTINKLKSLIDEPAAATQKTNEPIDISKINNYSLFKH